VNDMESGYINACDNMKGFGFIRRQKGRDLIFSYSDIVDNPHTVSLAVGLKVAFEVAKTKKGDRAIKIEFI